jgi:glutamate carboxypeptidase
MKTNETPDLRCPVHTLEELDLHKVRCLLSEIYGDLLGLLERMVATNSHASNDQGVRQTVELVSGALPASLKLREDAERCVWSFSLVEPPPAPPILLTGHVDTVFPPEQAVPAFKRTGPYLVGPGVADMKGGLIVMIGALQALDRLGLLEQVPLLIVLNGDEEMGSTRSATFLRTAARQCRAGLVFECGGLDGSVVTARRGLRRYRIEFLGRAAHSGNLHGPKESAVLELAHCIPKLEDLNDPDAGISINVGRICGGTAANVVPERASAEVEVRYWKEGQGEELERKVQALLSTPVQGGMEIRVERVHYRPSMPPHEPSRWLYRLAEGVARRLGYPLPEDHRGGASDANFLAAEGLPTLDGLGPVGEEDHSSRERIRYETLLPRMELLVHLLWALREPAVETG